MIRIVLAALAALAILVGPRGPRGGTACAAHSCALETAREAGGTHLRVVTAHGPVHLFLPAGYQRRSAGLVIYVHGLYVHVDEAWSEHRLAEQFAASEQNALFIAPEAPATADEEPPWAELETLIATTLRCARLSRPPGAVVAVGHSGAYRTLAAWLSDPSLRHLILIDALYGKEDEFRAWLDAGRARKITLVVKGTGRHADPFVRAFHGAVTVSEIPASFGALSRAQRTARLLCLRSQYGHMELITEGRALPVLLQRAALRRLARPPGDRPPPVTATPPLDTLPDGGTPASASPRAEPADPVRANPVRANPVKANPVKE